MAQPVVGEEIRYAQDFKSDVPSDARHIDRPRGNSRFGRTLGRGVATGVAVGLAVDLLSRVLARQPNRPEKCDLHWADREKLVECSPVKGGGGSCTAAGGFQCRVMIDGEVKSKNPAAFEGRDHLYECSCEAQ